MRIGIDIRAIGRQRTGDETYTLQLVKAIASEDKENKYFLYTDTKKKEEIAQIEKELNLKNDNFKIVSITPANKLIWTFFLLPGQARRDDLDVLHVQYIAPFFLSGKTKLITTIHDISFMRFPQFISFKDLFALRLLIPPSLKRADKIIAVSEFTKQELEDFYKIDANKIQVVYNGGVAPEFERDIDEKEVLKFREEYGIMKPYLLYLGTLQPRKNISFLIEVFVQLKLKRKEKIIEDLELVIRGQRKGHNYDQRLESALKEVSQKHPDIYSQIKFVDYISNERIPLIFKGAEAFCFPSRYEGFGLPLLESMSQGTPVVTGNSSCLPEIVADAGLICRENDYEDWLEKIFKVLTDKLLREKVVQKGYERVSDFSWRKNAQETINLYKTFKNKNY
jgi:glycosyltransferase involved in cell wall biosynthesis